MDDAAALLWLLPALPLAGALVLALAGRRLTAHACAWLASGTTGIAFLLLLVIGVLWLPAQETQVHTLWTWFSANGLAPTVALRLDGLSLTMAAVVTGVGFLVHLYSTEYMAGEEGYSRYFAWLNLFVAAMLVLVLADDLLLLFVGWEGVGLCSWLLIGFWYRDTVNGDAARKAMITTMAGDMFLVIGLLLLFSSFGTSAIPELTARMTSTWQGGTLLPTVAALLLLAGALGKSAQVPLQVWLPDAMAGPTPVSALIHAATMVTAGVYLVARLHPLFQLAPGVMVLIAWLGAATLLLAGASALVQTDIKRVLAYSTISQLGFMFMALGAGAWSAAVFHLFTHAFFKALLFLAAGAAILALGHEQDLRRMGGLRARAPWAFWGFLIGAASLAALPWVTAGFFSKDLILAALWQRSALWLAAWTGAVLTAAYMTRAVIIGLLGEPRGEVSHHTGWRMHLPMAVLAVPSLLAGYLELPPGLGNVHAFQDLLAPVFGVVGEEGAHLWPSLLAVLAPLLGIAIVWRMLRRPPSFVTTPAWQRAVAWAYAGWGFDRLYERALRGPYVRLARRIARDPVDVPVMAIGRICYLAWRMLSTTQDGRLRHYAAALAGGTVAALALVLA
ncbi:MAG: NADH-quinone oxidoreductase subunit L [Thiohalomonadaceae bacterium]